MEERSDRFTAVEDRFAGYQVYDHSGEKIGKVDDLFLDENDQPEYIGVKMGFLGTKSTLIPMDVVTPDDDQQQLVVSQPKQKVKDGPSFDDDREITPEYEQQVRQYYGLTGAGSTDERGGYGQYYGEETGTGPGIAMGDREGGEFREHGREEEGVREGESDLEDRDELRVQRTEEEVRAGVREREAGHMNVRKRVRTDREQLSVPKRREEVTVDRVPVNEVGTGAEIGEDEVSVPVVEEEVVVEKRPVVKEELRIRKDVVQEEEVVETDVRKEEVDIDDDTTTGRRGV